MESITGVSCNASGADSQENDKTTKDSNMNISPSKMTTTSSASTVQTTSTSTTTTGTTETDSCGLSTTKKRYASKSTYTAKDTNSNTSSSVIPIPSIITSPVETVKAEDTETSKKKEDDEDSESEEELATDNLLGRLRNGIRLIQVHARETMAQCDTDDARVDMAWRLETSTIRMLRAEKSFMNNARIIAEVVDEFAPDFEDDLDAVDEDDDYENTNSNNEVKDNPVQLEESKDDEGGIGDTKDSVKTKTKSVVPIIFRPTVENGASIRNYGKKLSKLMLKKLSDYEESLTDDVLRGEKKFLALKEQILCGVEDSENFGKRVALNMNMGSGCGDMVDFRTDSLVFDYESDEDEYYDESVLPSVDPITKQPIFDAVRNKFCNHVFDQQSVLEYMLENPEAKCPMIGCRNEKPLSPEQFVNETKLTERIRAKNAKMTLY